MGIDVGTWASVASLIVSILALFPRDRRKRTEKQQQALLAVSEAYHETAAYLESRASHGRDRDREWDIALKWHDAAWLLMRYDAELSRRIGMKSEFWREGGIWDPKAIKDANIGLTTIWREVKALLGSGEDSPQDDRAESDMIRFLCPNCGKKCKAPAEAAGRRARCVRCGIRLEVPTSENPLVPPEQTVAVRCPF